MKSLSTIPCIVSIAVLLFCTACAGTFYRNYGSIIPDADTTTAFESYRINPDFNYYISGSDIYPNAMIGLRKALTLDSDLWKKIEPTPQEFREIIQNMQKKALSLNQMQHGFSILDEKGRRIGIWYSILSAKTAIQTVEGNKVIIRTPDLDTYQKYERDASR